MDNIGYLIFGTVFGILMPFFGFMYTYKYLRHGKVRAIALNPGRAYSFKKEPVMAITILISTILGILISLISGIGMFLLYFHIIK